MEIIYTIGMAVFVGITSALQHYLSPDILRNFVERDLIWFYPTMLSSVFLIRYFINEKMASEMANRSAIKDKKKIPKAVLKVVNSSVLLSTDLIMIGVMAFTFIGFAYGVDNPNFIHADFFAQVSSYMVFPYVGIFCAYVIDPTRK